MPRRIYADHVTEVPVDLLGEQYCIFLLLQATHLLLIFDDHQ